MEQFVQLPRRDAAHFVRRSEGNASGFMQTLAYSAQSITKKSKPEIVSLDVRRERAMLLQQRRRMLSHFRQAAYS